MNSRKDLDELQNIIGYTFKDPEVLRHALRHSSYANEIKLPREGNNERLEFLGDAVLELSSSRFLYDNYTQMPEGKMTKLRASLVCEPSLAACAREITLDKYIRLGKGEENMGGRKRDSIISDALEAVIGAIYLDGGYDNAEVFVRRFILNDIEHKKLFYDSKTVLQEKAQAAGHKVEYVLVKEEGPDHCKEFFVNAYVDGAIAASGSGHSKKAAEMNAAYNAILKLKEHEICF